MLDVGSAGGDVALVAAEFVGHFGSVVGIEPSRDAVDFATRRASARGFVNVTLYRSEARRRSSLCATVRRIGWQNRADVPAQPSNNPPAACAARLIRRPRVLPGTGYVGRQIGSGGRDRRKSGKLDERSLQDRGSRQRVRPEASRDLQGSRPSRSTNDDRRSYRGKRRACTGTSHGKYPRDDPGDRAIGPRHFGREFGIETLEYRIRAELEAANATMSSPLLVSAWARIPS